MKICEECGKSFKSRIKINSEVHDIHNRSICTNCKPLQTHCRSNRETKKCSKCMQNFPNNIKHFGKKRNYLKSICRICDRKIGNRNDKNYKLKHLQLYGDNKCKICGYNKLISVLSFHHLDPNKKKIKL